MSTNPIDNNLPPERVLEGLINEMKRGLSKIENNLWLLNRIIDEDKRRRPIQNCVAFIESLTAALLSAEEYLQSYKEDE